MNAAIIMLADYLIEGFYVSGWGWALVFSLLLSILQTILFSILNIDRKKKG
ncbi:MAG: phage holin family protein [Flavobacteriaceae bacterium]